jgi:putative urate catabolism protein
MTAAAFEPHYPRDLIGYGSTPPHPRWPGRARVAVQFVLNYEEGGENSVLHGDAASETFLSEIVGAAAFPMRHLSMESIYEYGSRAGVWRLLRLFRERRMPITIFGVAMALARNPRVVDAMLADGHEIASHGWRWISYQHFDAAAEREHLERAVDTIRTLTGAAPLGWYTGRDSPHTRRLVVEHGGFLYDADSYADDLPYWVAVDTAAGTRAHLVVPYTLDTNDMRFATPQGFNSGEQFYAYLKDAFDVLYAEGDPHGLDAPKMLSIGLHCRIAGRPGRIAALARFLDHVQRHDDVWVARRVDIARHWQAAHPAPAPAP